MSNKRKRSTSPVGSAKEQRQHGETIFRSEELEDRQSRFRGYYSPTLARKELQRLVEIDSADHKILGWRRESNQQSLTAAKKYVAGNDDDGERFGGKKVEQCLANTNVTGACVVARWWGGVMLGPVRFTHIETCALGAIQSWRNSVAEQVIKKERLEHDTRETQRLVKVLLARDKSIVVLRRLASDKEAKLKAVEDNVTPESQASQTSAMAVTAPAYDGMPLHRLQGLEKARDATLSFLLKRIDRAELELANRKPDG